MPHPKNTPMQYVVAVAAVCCMRKEPCHKSEMVSQLLFGETASVIEVQKDFIKVIGSYDQYEGWVQTSQLAEVDEIFLAQIPAGYTYKRNIPFLIDSSPMFASLGTPVLPERYYGKYAVEYQEAESLLEYKKLEFDPYIIKSIAGLFLNVPYLWGGKSAFGIDCSGFTQQVYKVFDKKLYRDACQQAEQGELIGFLEEVICGDLAFFDNEKDQIVHVGILLNDHEIIHASGKVRIDKIDNLGIINTDTGQRTHRLRMIRRI